MRNKKEMSVHAPGIWVRWSLAVITAATLYTSALATPPAELCQSAKNKEAGKYDFCRQTAEAKLAATGDNAGYTAALATWSSTLGLAGQIGGDMWHGILGAMDSGNEEAIGNFLGALLNYLWTHLRNCG